MSGGHASSLKATDSTVNDSTARGPKSGTAKPATVHDNSWVAGLDDKAKRVIELIPADSKEIEELNAMTVMDREAKILEYVEKESRREKQLKLKELAKAKGKPYCNRCGTKACFFSETKTATLLPALSAPNRPASKGQATTAFVVNTDVLIKLVEDCRMLRARRVTITGGEEKKKAREYAWFTGLNHQIQAIVKLLPAKSLVAIDRLKPDYRPQFMLATLQKYKEQLEEHTKQLQALESHTKQSPNLGAVSAASAARSHDRPAASASTTNSASGHNSSIPLGEGGEGGSSRDGADEVVDVDSETSVGGSSEVGDDWSMPVDELISAGSANLAKSCVRFGMEKLASIEVIGDHSWGAEALETVKSTSEWEKAVEESKSNIQNSIDMQNAKVGGRRKGKKGKGRGKRKTKSTKEVGGGDTGAYATDVIRRIFKKCRPGGTAESKTFVFLDSKLVGGTAVKVVKTSSVTDPLTNKTKKIKQLPLQISQDALDVILRKPTRSQLLAGQTRLVLVLGFLNKEFFAHYDPDRYDESDGTHPSWHHALLVDRDTQTIYDSNFSYLVGTAAAGGLHVKHLDPRTKGMNQQPLLRQIRRVYWISFLPPTIQEESSIVEKPYTTESWQLNQKYQVKLGDFWDVFTLKNVMSSAELVVQWEKPNSYLDDDAVVYESGKKVKGKPAGKLRLCELINLEEDWQVATFFGVKRKQEKKSAAKGKKRAGAVSEGGGNGQKNKKRKTGVGAGA